MTYFFWMYHDEIMTLKLANPGAPNRPNLGTLRSLEAEMKEYDPPGNHGFFFYHQLVTVGG